MQMPSRVTLRSWIVGMAMAALLATTPAVSAASSPGQREPNGDKRIASCDAARIKGSLLDAGDLSASKTEPDGRYLTIRTVSDGITITGVVVAGGNGYNLYVPGERGVAERPPWKRLHAPAKHEGEVPSIKRWFACGVSTPSAPHTSSARPPVADGALPAQRSALAAGSSSPGADNTRSASSGRAGPASERGAVSTSATPPAEPTRRASTPEALAHTGFGDGELAIFGLALVLAGSAVLVALRLRRRRW